MTSSFNSRYYYLTLDTIGAIDQNFSSCPSGNTIFGINDGFAWGYKCENYKPNNGNSGVKAIRANKNFVYTHNGTTVQKRSLTTGAVITSATIPGGLNVTSAGKNQAGCGGIDIDSCGNVYVGSTNAVIKYDANLVQLSTTATSFRVFDIAVSSTGNVFACGATGDNSNNTRTGYIQQINMSSCNPMTLVCCNTNVCAAGPFCSSDAPVTLTPGQSGGTWSGPGVNASGVFSPSTAGAGTHTINYTLPCGTGAMTIVVNPCTISPITACQTSSGQITASNGVGTYTWYHSTTTTPCVPGFGNCSGFGTVPGTPVTTWSSFATGPTITPGTNYPIWVVDSNGDSLKITALNTLPNCTSCPSLTVTSSSQVNVSCFGQSTGSFSVSTSGGASPYDYTLMNGATTVSTFANVAGSQAFSNLPAGSYTLNVLDNNGCPGSTTITITQPASASSVTITSSANASCGGANGSATATASGGSSPYDYVWAGNSGTLQTTNNIAGANTLSGLTAGTYTVTITDNNNCTASTTVTITNSSAGTVTISSQTNVLCFGMSTGAATATASGGSSPYDYVWTGAGGTLQTTNNIAGSNSITGLAAGTYTITVTDNAGCTSTSPVTITQPASGASVSLSSTTDASCGASNGSATVTAAGGTSPYDYVWSGSSGTLQTTNNIAGPNSLNSLPAGTYTVTVTDNNNCTATVTATINNTGGPAVSITSQTNILCFGSSTGDATATASGGSGPYDYVWTGSSGTLLTTNNISGPNSLSAIAAGTYTISVTDNSGCISSTSVTITQPNNASTVTITGSANASCGGTNGSATATAGGGTSPYDYVWTGSSGTLQTTNNIAGANTLSGLAAGTYTVTVTDANNCTTSTTAVITSSGGATVSITAQTDVMCFGTTTGSATATAAGGTSPYNYVWSGNSGVLQTTNGINSSDALNGLAAGTYTVAVTDNAGCVSSTNVTITQPTSAANIAVTGTTAASCGSANGTATAQASGGSSPYDYVWTNGTGTLQTTNNTSGADVLNNLAAGTYTVTVTDNNGCTASVTAVISNIGGATTTITASSNNSCFGGINGSATANTTGGSSPYDYVWTGTSGTLQTATNITTSNTINGLPAGTYTVTVTDNGGCISNTTVTITQPASALSLSTTASAPTTCGLNNGTATVSSVGGTPGYTYSWSPSGGTGSTAGSLASGTYTITVTDANSCTATTTASIAPSSGVSVSTANTPVSCNGGSNGTATASPSGGTGMYSYSWNNGSSSAGISGLSAGTYTVTVTSGSCSNTATATITQPAALTATLSTTPATCTSATGTASINITSGGGPFSYTWTNGSTGSTVNNLPSGNISVTVSYGSGCSQNFTGTVGSTGTITASAGNNVSIISGESTTLTATGGTSYLWSPVTGLSCNTCPSPVASPSSTTEYCVNVTDANGCSDSACVVVDVDIKCGELFVPNAFSPNNDNENDILFVMGNCVTNLNFAVFDRWGEKVFESSDQANGWDGTMKGKRLDSAVFVYYLTATVDGKEVKKHGNITLIK
jgi:gliding motility-associated-like protein